MRYMLSDSFNVGIRNCNPKFMRKEYQNEKMSGLDYFYLLTYQFQSAFKADVIFC